ncbi:hypothetical protein SRHO_G00184340 [Serrasalmus rhombeus]
MLRILMLPWRPDPIHSLSKYPRLLIQNPANGKLCLNEEGQGAAIEQSPPTPHSHMPQPMESSTLMKMGSECEGPSKILHEMMIHACS